ncbi:hypothetical protein [Corallococcus macrosporus]|uniref:Uncharacterized protein n=1 Tax=Corallococcus macrosporus DSM 14697 TaxID=1189310 RepID=A0A250JMZ9_9BACT|nr:hypothetical protein [Corallococcus macrosporus]ATB45244.1 hypothetical protein MYMAC_000829 [Corallococcus macrosporus DSM 14697]
MHLTCARPAVIHAAWGLVRLPALLLLLVLPWRAGAEPALRVAGASASNEVKLRTASEDFRHVLRVDLLSAPQAASDVAVAGGVAAGGAADGELPGGVTVLVDPLQSQDGAQVALRAVVQDAEAGSATAPISTRRPIHVELTGRLPVTGDYTGQVVLVHAGGRETTALIVTRLQAVPTVQFVATSPAVTSAGWGWSSIDATVRLPFKETAGVGGYVSVPQLLQLQRKAPDMDSALIQPRFQRVRFSLEGGKPDGGDLDVTATDGGIPVSAHGSGALLVHLQGLEGPGEYTGSVRLAVRSGLPVEQPFTLWVGSPWLWGALLIAAGAVSSFGVRLYSQRIRPRTLRLQRAMELHRRIQALVSGQAARAREVGQALLGQVAGLASEIRRPVRGIRVGDDALAAMEPRMRLYGAWCDASRKLEALPQELRPQQASALLAEVEGALRAEDTATEQMDGSLARVRELDVDGLARAGLEARLQDIDRQAHTLMEQHGDDSLSFRLKYELVPLLTSVRHELARGALEAGRHQLEFARRSYFDILCEELAAAVASRNLPRGFTEEEWEALSRQVKTLLERARERASTSVDDAVRMYQGAHAAYVRQLIVELRGAVDDARQVSESEAQTQALDEVEERLREAMGLLVAESSHLAASKYGEARDRFVAASQSQRSARSILLESLGPGGEGAALPATPPPTAPGGGRIPSLPDAPSDALAALGDFEGMPLPSPRHMWLVELGVLALLTTVAVALGLQLLNVFSPTWGGFGAGMTAFLWGFGLHQVGNATFEGITGLLTRVERPATPPPAA